jgi:hypothetical protein
MPYKDIQKRREFDRKRYVENIVRRKQLRESARRRYDPVKQAEKGRRLRANNLERHRANGREAARKRRRINREAVNAEVQAWRKANPDRQKAILRRSYLKNPQKFKDAWGKYCS